MPNSLVERKGNRENQRRARKQLREKLARKLATEKGEDPKQKPVVFVVPKVPKEIIELQELETQKLTNHDEFSSFFENLLNQAGTRLKLFKEIQKKKTEHPPGPSTSQ